VSATPSGSGGGKLGQGDYRALALAGTAVTEMAAPIIIGVWLDNKYGWAPWGLTVGAVLGIVGGIAHLVWVANRLNAEPPKPPAPKPDANSTDGPK